MCGTWRAHLTAFAHDVPVNVALFVPGGFMGRLVLVDLGVGHR